jgi:hypothetical protein
VVGGRRHGWVHGAGEEVRTGRRVLVASATLLVLMAIGGTLLATGAGNRDGDPRQTESIQTSELPAGGGVPGLSDPARPTSVGSTTSLDPRTGEATTSPSTGAGDDRTSGNGDDDDGSANAAATDRDRDGGGNGNRGDGATDDSRDGGDSRDSGDSRDDPANDRSSRPAGDGTRRGDGRYASDPSDPSGTTDPPTTGDQPFTAPDRSDAPPVTPAPGAPAPHPQPDQDLVENLFGMLLGSG